MGKEIEKRLLLAEGASIPIPEEHTKIFIKQGYIHVESNKQIRIRISKIGFSEEAYMCVKYTENIVRDEFEFPLGRLDEAKALYKKCDWTLEKKRLTFAVGKTHFDVDLYPTGLVLVEVEFKTLGAMNKWKKPHWVGEEITGIKKYSNITLAKKNLKF